MSWLQRLQSAFSDPSDKVVVLDRPALDYIRHLLQKEKSTIQRHKPPFYKDRLETLNHVYSQFKGCF